MAAMKGGRHGMISHSKRMANARHARRGWEDYELTRSGHRGGDRGGDRRSDGGLDGRGDDGGGDDGGDRGGGAAEGNTSVVFSWKPEIHTGADGVAFRTRFCPSPPDVVYLGKGLHDACRHPRGTLDEYVSHAESQLRALAQTLKCLPSKTLVVLRTPYYVKPLDHGGGQGGGVGGRSEHRCNNATWEHVRVEQLRDLMLKLHRMGVFGGHTLLLDAFALTEAASRQTSDPALQTLDGHHYPFAIGQIELWLLWHAFQSRGNGGCNV
jgi:hypothetical protein